VRGGAAQLAFDDNPQRPAAVAGGVRDQKISLIARGAGRRFAVQGIGQPASWHSRSIDTSSPPSQPSGDREKSPELPRRRLSALPNVRLAIEYGPPDQLQVNPRNPRTHAKKQIASSIQRFGFNSIHYATR